MKKRKVINLSTHQLVDFLLRQGSIDTRIFNQTTMNEGSRLHAYYQSKQGDDYLAEYFLKHTFLFEDYEVNLSGRADGIILSDKLCVVDEIKTTLSPLEEFKNEHMVWHLGQAKCYAFMFMDEKKLDRMGIKLTYIRQGKKEKRVETFNVTYEEVKSYVYGLIENYLLFNSILERKKVIRNETIKTLDFPFKTYRKGQRELAKFVYGLSKNGGRLFVEAPTGIGKSMSTIYPLVKALLNNDESKVFYLTAKGSGKEAALNALSILRDRGMKLTSISIVAKDKICPQNERLCNPDDCPFAKNYYSKIKDILKSTLLEHDNLTHELILDISKKHEICPFEFQLDLSLYSDFIICDYNYLFDPSVYMKRYFDEDASMHYVLVDEAHNLIDRSKDMYSASLSLSVVKEAKKALKEVESPRLKRSVNKLIKEIKAYEIFKEEKDKIFADFYNLDKSITTFLNAYLDTSKDRTIKLPKEVIDLYIDSNKFIKTLDYIGENYVCYAHYNKKNIILNIRCLDAARFIKRCSSLVKCVCFFSATLTPKHYFIDLLGGEESDPFLSLNSSFDKHNLSLLVAPNISVKYTKRKETYKDVADYIKALVSTKVGNYIIYTPSYEYLNDLIPYLELEDVNLLIQSKDMSDIEKEEFVSSFKENPMQTHVGLCVIGGAFSEGIDLVNTRLIGVVIIGVGMPKICFELDYLASYYDDKGFKGKDYAYINPGMNKVMQAVGRVIRTNEDRGVVLLVDERYMTPTYRDLFKKEWDHYKVVFKESDIINIINKFYGKEV